MGRKFVASLFLAWVVSCSAVDDCEICQDVSNSTGNIKGDSLNCSCIISNATSSTTEPSENTDLPDLNAIINLLHEIIENLMYGKQEDSVDSIVRLFSLLSTDVLADSKDAQYVQNVLKRNLEGVLSKFAIQIGVFFNPYIMKNSKVEQMCHGDSFCILNGLLARRDKILVKYISDLVPDIIDGLINSIDDLDKMNPECDVKHCVFTRTVLENKTKVKDLLQDSKVFKDFVAKYTVALVSSIIKSDIAKLP
nr:uncharacterized protein LOC111502987 [Leptinotarsa decemlineata]